jgi:hypothetical protein
MLNTLSELASKLHWLKPIAYFLGLGTLALVIKSLFFSAANTGDVYLIPGVLGFIWSLLLISMLLIFPGTPGQPVKTDKFFRRIKIRIIRGVYFLLALLFIGLTLAILLLSLKLIGVWRELF